jgi:hypothetical protein
MAMAVGVVSRRFRSELEVTRMNTSNPSDRSRGRSSFAPLAAAAGAAVALLAAASPALAQYRVGADGHLNDANNRAGSGGYNTTSDASYRSALNGQIITGNSTGLSYFHGGTDGEFDSNVFQGSTNDAAVQSFNAISAPVNTASRTTGQSVYQPYYNTQSYATQPPPSFTTTSNGVGFTSAPVSSPLTPSADTRVGDLNAAPTDLQGTNLATPGTLDQAGPVNNVGNDTLYSLSPLYGVRELQAGNQTQGNRFMSRSGDNPLGAGPRMDPNDIQQLRKDLEVAPADKDQTNGDQTPGTDNTDNSANPGNPANGAGNGVNPSAPGTLGQPAASGRVSGTSVANAAITGAAITPQRVSSSINAPYGSQQQNLLIPADQQSRQILALQQRFVANNPHPNAVEAANQTNRLILAVRKQEADALKIARAKAGMPDNTAGSPDAAGNAGVGAAPMTGGSGIATAGAHPQPTAGAKPADLAPIVRDPNAAEPVANPDQPFVITSLASGIRAKGLADLLRSAEGQMRSGQFGQAVDTYDTAGEVAPNNPFVPLGRAFAELGASYYGRAEIDLTRAISTEPAVLAAQYDLKGFLGQDRLKFVQKDLTDIGTTEQTARPYLLLAYIDHNTGADDATVTAKDLDTAEARGANQQVIDLMREAWNLKPAAK